MIHSTTTLGGVTSSSFLLDSGDMNPIPLQIVHFKHHSRNRSFLVKSPRQIPSLFYFRPGRFSKAKRLIPCTHSSSCSLPLSTPRGELSP